MPAADALKGLACILIVWHHLAFYGPMSDVARPLAPALFNWLYADGRMAVQVFLAVSGFLLARGLGLGRWPDGVPSAWIGRRYLRLVLPYALALLLAIVAAAVARAWIPDDGTVPGPPHAAQLVAHLLLLQDLLDVEALSAGVWYVAIDFQLFVCAVGLCLAGRALQRWPLLAGRAPEVWLVAGVAAASLLWFNRDARLDETALYFAGAHGLGLLAGWAVRSRRPGLWLAAVALLGLAALALDWRGRIAVALATALVLGVSLLPAARWRWRCPSALERLSEASYCVFLVHYPVCLLVSAAWSLLWPTQPLWNAVGMLLAFGLSLLAGQGLHRIELQLQRPRAPLGLWMALAAAGVLVLGLSA
ncbi:acyltransferase family protein [Pseudorhodoferax sp.]|uniref:acyltransferase family protein n=1 Tax=Pseudorhodoferax sp. TaxID=1993553 RepID=UPI002DD6AF58|nr:acyltransferase family protein [Pseudorhodoferax sp.]